MGLWPGAAEVPAAVPEGLDSLIPAWITDLGWVGIALLIAVAFYKNWIYSSGQHEKLLEAERKVGEVWKENAEQLKPVLEELVKTLEPLGQGNAAILKAVEALQQSNELDRRFRDRRDSS